MRSAKNDLPNFNTALGQDRTLYVDPPIRFGGTLLRYFPLRAQITALQSLLDRWLNFRDPNSKHWFEACAPFVYLVLGRYERISMMAGNMGGGSESEAAFLVPVLWYVRSRDGRFRPHSMALVPPLVFVNSPITMLAGRNDYGWKKVLSKIVTPSDAWQRQTDYAGCLARVNAYGSRNPTGKERRRTVLQILRQEEPTLQQLVSRGVASYASLAGWLSAAPSTLGTWSKAAFQGVGRQAERGRHHDAHGPWQAMNPVAELTKLLGASFRTFLDPTNMINLRQFRAGGSELSDRAAYQELTLAPMHFSSIEGMAMMNPSSFWLGDPSAGYEIHIPRSSFNIVENLGLDVFSKIDGTSIIHPTAPYWLYGTLAEGRGESLQIFEGNRSPKNNSKPDNLPRFRDPTGVASQQLQPPFTCDNVKCLVLSLDTKGKDKVLRRLARDYLNCTNQNFKVRSVSSKIYVVATQFRNLTETSNRVQIQPVVQMLSFVFWVKDETDSPPKFVIPFSFCEHAEVAATLGEIGGINCFPAKLRSPPSLQWPGEVKEHKRFPGEQQRFLNVRASVLPAANQGLLVKWEDVVDLSWSDTHPRPKKSDPNEHSCPLFKTKSALQTSLFEFLALKQFRDVEHSNKACYQRLVSSKLEFDRVEHEPLDPRISFHVRIPHYPTLPIVQTLGIENLAHVNGSCSDSFLATGAHLFTGKLRLSLGNEL